MSGDEGQMSSALSAGAFTQYPLYKEVKLRITKSLMDGQWKSGEALPSEAQLARGFNVSIGTLRKAVDELVQEKVLVRQQGRGTFVATHNESRTLYYFFHIVGEDGVRRFPTSELLAFSRGKLADIPGDRQPFAPSQPVPAGAAAIDRLAACLGRDAAWHTPSPGSGA